MVPLDKLPREQARKLPPQQLQQHFAAVIQIHDFRLLIEHVRSLMIQEHDDHGAQQAKALLAATDTFEDAPGEPVEFEVLRKRVLYFTDLVLHFNRWIAEEHDYAAVLDSATVVGICVLPSCARSQGNPCPARANGRHRPLF
jgi:hypothetical protein